jgi:hypothetical protein
MIWDRQISARIVQRKESRVEEFSAMEEKSR